MKIHYALLMMFSLLYLSSCLPLPQSASAAGEGFLQPKPTYSPAGNSLFKKDLAPEYHAVFDELSGASVYTIFLKIEDPISKISGEQTVVYTNTENVTLYEVGFRLFPNILRGVMRVDNLTINGQTAVVTYDLENSLMRVSLNDPLETGDQATFNMEFNVKVSEDIRKNYGVQAYYNDVLALAHIYPMIAVYDENGWNAELPPQSGDVTFADMSFYLVTVDAPADLVLVGSGVEINRQNNGSRQKITYEAGPARDFYIAASASYQVFSKQAGDVKINFYTRDFMKEGALSGLEFAENALEVFERRYGKYPYTELDFVSTPTMALGIEYPGMIALTEWIISPDNKHFETTVVHEIAHQWFYNLVGNDQLDEPWLDESMAQLATSQYYLDVYGQERHRNFQSDLEKRWEMAGSLEMPINQPVRAFNSSQYSGVVYGRGALFFEAMRNEIGADAFDAFMSEYVAANGWKIATTQKLQATAEAQCACNLNSLFAKWIYP